MNPATLLRTAAAGVLTVCLLSAADPLANRIGHTDPTKFQHRESVHAGAGPMRYTSLLPGGAIHNLGFLHRGQIMPGGGIGHHFHNSAEEMFVIFNGEAQFTVDGRTSVVKGPVGIPVRQGHSHAIVNASSETLEWMNIQVRMDGPRLDRSQDPSGSFDLDDDRVGVPLDKVPVFMTTKLYRDMLPEGKAMYGGEGKVQYRRSLGPTAYYSNWAYVDHMLLPAGSSVGRHVHQGVEEFYYVMDGSGEIAVNKETAAVTKGDAIPIHAKESHALKNTGAGPLEVIIVGVSLEKGVIDTAEVQ